MTRRHRARLATALRATAWGMVAAGVAAPVLRKRVPVSPVVVQAVAFGAPLGLCVAVRRSRARDVAACALQMWAYVAEYKSPHDDAGAQAGRVHVTYPILADRVLGLGELPTVRLQRALAREGGAWTLLDRVLVWTHWSWFAFPHGALVYILMRDQEHFARAAVLTYAVFDIGASVYWVLPTAPPWYAAETQAGDGGAHASTPAVRRMMVEYGESFWGDGWGSLYSLFGGNPLAAMPSLHFATSTMATLLLSESGPVAGAVGLAYTVSLGVALVYLGEHYVVDLLAGAALAIGMRALAPRVRPAVECVGRGVARLEAAAHAPA